MYSIAFNIGVACRARIETIPIYQLSPCHEVDARFCESIVQTGSMVSRVEIDEPEDKRRARVSVCSKEAEK